MDNSLVTLKLITQQAAEIATPNELIRFLVTRIKEAMHASSCSLYLMDGDHQLVLAATDGLDPASVNQVRLPVGQGLVGLIASTLHPLNLDRGSDHPAFKYFRETQEEQFNAFLGAPLVHFRKTLGVLNVQKREAVRFSDVEEAFLVTVGAQLAGIVDRFDWTAAADKDPQTSRRYQGIRGAAGIGIGHLRWIDADLLRHVPDRRCADPELEIVRFKTALAKAKVQIRGSHSAFPGTIPKDVGALFDVYAMLLDSPELVSGVVEKIREGNWAEGALRATVDNIALVFSVLTDPYLQARAEDIHHVGNKIYAVLAESDKLPSQDPESPIILIGELVGITDIARFNPRLLAGVVCTRGSALSHTAVLASALGFPAVMGIGEIRDLPDNTAAIIDGHLGCLIVNPAANLTREYHKVLQAELQFTEELGELSNLPAVTYDGREITLLANTGLLADITPGLNRGAAGIGLYRSEIPFLTHDTFPTEEEQYQIYRHVLSCYQGKPVYMRTLDIGGDKVLPYFTITEDNPSLGWRGIRFSLDNPPIFMTQLRAMLRASRGLDNLHILIPMVSRVDEVVSFRIILKDAMEQLRKEGNAVTMPRLGIMVEVPAAITLLEFMRPYIDFASIGTNDLAQYLLAADRGNPRVSSLVDNLHPAVIHELNNISRRSAAMDLPISVCGEIASDPYAVPLLMAMGIRTLSLSVHNLPRIKWLIRHLTFASTERLLEEVLQLGNEREIRDRVHALLDRPELQRLLSHSG